MSTEPAGFVTVSNDGSYEFLHNGPPAANFGGKLTPSELSELRAQLANLESVQQSDADYVACEKLEQGYSVASGPAGASVCYEATGSADSASRAAVEFLADFYQQKSEAP